MTAYPPIGTLPGITSQLNDVDILIATLASGGTVTGALLRHTDYDDGGATNTSVVGSIRNATGGGGDGIAFTIVDQTQSIQVSGSLSIAAGGSVYLRVSAGSASMSLTGWISLEGGVQVTTALTDLTRVKRFLGISVTTDDALLTNLINAVSDEIQKALRRTIIQATATAEKYDSIGDSEIILRNRPVVSVASVLELTTALVEDTGWEAGAQDLAVGRLVRISGGLPIGWARGTRVVVVTYDHGLATVPEALAEMATELVAYDYRQSKPGGGRLGLANKPIDQGGSPSFLDREAIWAAQRHRFEPYQRAWV